MSNPNPTPMITTDKIKLIASAHLAQRLYPGPVGELIYRELMTWEEFGYRFGNGQLIDRLIKHLDAELNSRAQAKDS